MEEVVFMVPQRRHDLEFGDPIIFKSYEINRSDYIEFKTKTNK